MSDVPLHFLCRQEGTAGPVSAGPVSVCLPCKYVQKVCIDIGHNLVVLQQQIFVEKWSYEVKLLLCFHRSIVVSSSYYTRYSLDISSKSVLTLVTFLMGAHYLFTLYSN